MKSMGMCRKWLPSFIDIFFTTRSWNVCIFDPECCRGYRVTWMQLFAPQEGCGVLCMVEWLPMGAVWGWRRLGSARPPSPPWAGNSQTWSKESSGWCSALGRRMGIMPSCLYHSYKCLLGDAHEISPHSPSIFSLEYFCVSLFFIWWFD